jgi:hypothetical protein
MINPLSCFLRLYDEVLGVPSLGNLFFLVIGLILGWWVYVPIHELLHAAGCLMGGGSVTRLEIGTIYGGNLLSHLFSFVVGGSEYAGRLSGFDTGHSDLTYAFTVYFPFLASLAGFSALKWAAARKSRLLFFFFIPLTGAPLTSISGDFFELGSLLLFQFWQGPNGFNRLLISDDLVRLLGAIHSGSLAVPVDASTGPFIVFALLFGICMAWATLKLSEMLSTLKEGMIKNGEFYVQKSADGNSKKDIPVI